MAIPPVSSVPGALGAAGVNNAQSVAPRAADGFGDTINKALEAVSDAEFAADAIAESVATGGDATVQELMVSMTKAQLNVDLLVQVRNKAVEAYQEIMRMQV
ncbi:MAG: flagellar hook-basal body complex protein FliE [Acidimicrobiia bacterium]|nr:flagellar hook-basal body complex protein FliE [Acidimicrobiia bacterium]